MPHVRGTGEEAVGTKRRKSMANRTHRNHDAGMRPRGAILTEAEPGDERAHADLGAWRELLPPGGV